MLRRTPVPENVEEIGYQDGLGELLEVQCCARSARVDAHRQGGSLGARCAVKHVVCENTANFESFCPTWIRAHVLFQTYARVI